MNYTEWKQEYLELLIELIKQHQYSKNYTQDYIDELVIELLERFSDKYRQYQLGAITHRAARGRLNEQHTD